MDPDVSALGPTAWTALIIAWLAAVASPGPDIFLLMRLAVRRRRAAVLAALGIMTGNTLWILFSVLGISVLLIALPWLLQALQVLGSLVLIALGVQSIRAGLAGLKSRNTESVALPPRRPFALGFVTNIANPKALIFFTALLSQFLPPEATALDRALVIIVMITTGLFWFIGVALACSSRAFRRWFQHAAPWFDIVAGAVFVLVAVVLLIELVAAAL